MSNNPDPRARADAESHLELASRYLEEGEALIDRDPVQASEKLYKAAEEAIKALTMHLNISEVLNTVDNRDRWTVTELEKAVRVITRKIGNWFVDAWDAANYLHVWGFHEAKLEPDDIRIRLPHIERMVSEAQKLVKG
ncbi:MAG: PaREP1 family protein [Vulcanisaeta sp.]|nr:PaREP1 family protein [Vulcanisaeta sp.]